VKTGIGDANYVEIVGGGLKEGDPVVVGTTGPPAPAKTSGGGPGRGL